MRQTTSTLAALALLVVSFSPSRASAETLSNDSFVSGSSVAFSAGFVAGEMAAARFTPSAPGRLTTLSFIFGGSTTMTTVRVHVWDDAARTTSPGTELFAADYMLTGSDSGLGEIDLTTAGIHVTDSFRVGFEFTTDGVPCLGRDTDGTRSVTNNLMSVIPGGWMQSMTAGVTGDWILRAVVVPDPVDGGMTVDASTPIDAALDSSTPVDAGTDASAHGCHSNLECATGQYCSAAGACTFDCRTSTDCASGATCNSLGQCVAPPAPSGCGCRVTHEPRGVPAFLALLGAALLYLRRRRRQTGRNTQLSSR